MQGRSPPFGTKTQTATMRETPKTGDVDGTKFPHRMPSTKRLKVPSQHYTFLNMRQSASATISASKQFTMRFTVSPSICMKTSAASNKIRMS